MDVTILQEMITLLTGGITGIAEGVGSGLQALATNMFLDTTQPESPTLSAFGGLVVIFGGVSLAIGLCRLVFHFITSLGARN